MRAGMLGKILVGSVFAAVLCAPVVVWLVSVKNPMAYLNHTLPPGQSIYVVSKLAGLLALSVFWLQCLLGLAPRTPVLNGLPSVSGAVHRRLGWVAFALVLGHVALFITAASLRTGAPAWNLLWPNFTHGYYSAFVSVGLIALWLLILGVYAGWKTSRGYRGWKKMHMAWVIAFVLVFLHAYTIGSESRYGAMRYVLLFIATSVVAAALSRAHAAFGSKKSSSASALENR